MYYTQRMEYLRKDRDLKQETVANIHKHGHIEIHISELIAKAGISKNWLCHHAELQRTSLNQYCNNTITRLDTEVLARICSVLHCEIGDLLEFIPDAPQEK